jgi:hypothetical protein
VNKPHEETGLDSVADEPEQVGEHQRGRPPERVGPAYVMQVAAQVERRVQSLDPATAARYGAPGPQ